MSKKQIKTWEKIAGGFLFGVICGSFIGFISNQNTSNLLANVFFINEEGESKRLNIFEKIVFLIEEKDEEGKHNYEINTELEKVSLQINENEANTLSFVRRFKNFEQKLDEVSKKIDTIDAKYIKGD